MQPSGLKVCMAHLPSQGFSSFTGRKGTATGFTLTKRPERTRITGALRMAS